MIARRRETEIRNALRKRELIPRALVLKQAAFLVISLRQRLLAIAAQSLNSIKVGRNSLMINVHDVMLFRGRHTSDHVLRPCDDRDYERLLSPLVVECFSAQ